jgi:hypothetical protein
VTKACLRLSCILACFAVSLRAAPEEPIKVEPFAVIVANDIPERSLSAKNVALIFRRRQVTWNDGLRTQPVNLPASNAVRRAFSQCVLGELPQAMENYWRQMYFHGVLPPHVVESEQAVALFVASTPGAIGYVSSCPKDLVVNVIFTVGDVPNCPKRSVSCESLQDS